MSCSSAEVNFVFFFLGFVIVVACSFILSPSSVWYDSNWSMVNDACAYVQSQMINVERWTRNVRRTTESVFDVNSSGYSWFIDQFLLTSPPLSFFVSLVLSSLRVFPVLFLVSIFQTPSPSLVAKKLINFHFLFSDEILFLQGTSVTWTIVIRIRTMAAV